MPTTSAITKILVIEDDRLVADLMRQVLVDDGYDVEVVEIELAVAGSSLRRDDYSGRAKLVIDKATDVILGATFAGPEVSELVHAATIAVVYYS